MTATPPDVDYLVIGGGFYGCALALFLRSLSPRVVLVEAGQELLGRASRTNQARIHTGFHYPRSALTAVKSLVLHRRFAADFPDAVVDSFQMLYGVARRRSKVSARRFHRMFAEMGAPIAPASPSQSALFDAAMVEQVFACDEFAFDSTVLARHMARTIDAQGIALHLGTEVIALEETATGCLAHLADGRHIHARFVFNVTYSQINRLLAGAGLPPAGVKHELAEIALVEVPPQLAGVGLTIVDGPFASCMPYPAAGLHSLTHVRYTPHASWTDTATPPALPDGAIPNGSGIESRHRHMLLDARRYVPALAEARWHRSLFEVKTLLLRNEKDDGRPILFQRNPATSRVISVLGGKIDNIYDLFDLMRKTEPEWAAASERLIRSGPRTAGGQT